MRGGSLRWSALLSRASEARRLSRSAVEPRVNQLTAALDAGEEAGGCLLPRLSLFFFETSLVPPPATLFL